MKMNKTTRFNFAQQTFKTLVLFALVFGGTVFAQDMRRNSTASLFSDYKASKLGDAITIFVVENSAASNQAETQAGRTSDLGLSTSGETGKTTLPKLNATLGTSNDFKGAGSTRSAGSVTAKISATIDSVLDNGNIRVKGYRKIVVNGEEQMISIKGIVRTSDITSDNTVLSYNITDAVIVFEGNGIIQRSQNPGWLTKFIHWLF